uniref:Cytochrome P450 n=1 Tax=Knipowitschia caucasica TaxID=637954 RepID=A0AAV2L7K3_KNICA
MGLGTQTMEDRILLKTNRLVQFLEQSVQTYETLICLFLHEKSGDISSSFSEDQLSAFLLDLHFAGTDTTANTLLSAFLYLMNYPQVQEQCQQEIDRVLEGKVVVSYEDRHLMPFTQAVIHEIQLVSDTVPLAVYHQATRDTDLLGQLCWNQSISSAVCFVSRAQ